MKRRKERCTITVAGAHRGAEYLLDPLVAWQTEAAQSALVRLVDVLPGRVDALAAQAAARGLTTEPVAARLEDILSEGVATDKALILTLDQPGSIARALWLLLEAPVYILGYLLLRLPNGLLWGLAMSLPPEDRNSRERAARFFEALAAVLLPTGSRAIIGAEGQPEHLLAEGLLRSFLGAHLKENLSKVAAGLSPVGSALVVTDDGATSSPLIVVGDQALPTPDMAVVPREPGSSVVFAELGEGSIRFVKVRLRGTRRLCDEKSAPEQTLAASTLVPGGWFPPDLTEARELTIASTARPVAMTD